MDDKLPQIPDQVHTGRAQDSRTYTFDRMCTITGDACYKYTDDKGNERHAILVNPEAKAHQLRVLSSAS